MALEDRKRKNVAVISHEERIAFRDAILELDSKKIYPDGVSYWDKQDQIHQVNHIHGGANFLPFHRNVLNKFEELLREINPKLSLHYWDYLTDPRISPNGSGGTVNLFTTGEHGFMGSPTGMIGIPLDSLTNKGEMTGSREQSLRPQDPPRAITREVGSGAIVNYPEVALMTVADTLSEDNQYRVFAPDLEAITTQACEYIGGTIGGVEHKVFQDPFSFLISSNTDRLWASWQLQKNHKWRLEPEKLYGRLSNDTIIREYFEPWAGGFVNPEKKISPWGIQWERELVNCKDPLIVKPTRYDTYAGDYEL